MTVSEGSKWTSEAGGKKALRILIDICHPAHVHFFRNPIGLLKQRGHEVVITSRIKEMATRLLDDMGVAHHILSTQEGGSAALLRELFIRNFRLRRFVLEYRPDVMTAIGGIFISHVGVMTGTPAVIFYDTENAYLQNFLTYPFASRIYVPECYPGWLPEARAERYCGYHELSYLHPEYFQANRAIALANGLAPDGDTFFVRLVSWKANHDIGKRGWTDDLLRSLLVRLAPLGRVLISSESDLPGEFAQYRYRGDPQAIHHVMAYCRGYVGESATMTSECAMLGVPAVYVADIRLSCTREQQDRFGLVRNVRSLESEQLDSSIDWIMSQNKSDWQNARQRLLSETIDVAAHVADAVEAIAIHRA